ncbi:hypothetical protein L873DRAFT_560572 [Choiromyces venosus 120613-1]|uniref:Uncharacterized protein n=1 Tax=Choiromyces venosus 120613-1 TaxID=1336337 RepID=A0A3N4K7J2_9PEZI|nr:hypothetical protein L873DRAFT_560572 [Choiromyces venosus 120613-1]
MARLQKTVLSIFFVLRFLQLAASAITGFIYCYLIWHHNNHYCVYYPSRCSPAEKRNVDIPYQYILITAAVCLCFINILATTIYFINVAEKIVYPVLVVTDGIVLAVYAAGLITIFRVPGSSFWCNWFETPTDPRASVVARNCVISQDGKGALAFVVGLTGILLIFAILKSIQTSCCIKPSPDGEEEGTTTLVGDPGETGAGGADPNSHISVDIDVAAFMSHEQRMVIGIGDATEVAEDEKPARPVEPHPAERERAIPVGEMEISEMSKRHGHNII